VTIPVASVLRLYLGWRLFRLLRPLLGAGVIVAAALALHVGHAPVNRSAAAEIKGGAAGATRNLPRALERAFRAGSVQP
jgi:hypothetical protein